MILLLKQKLLAVTLATAGLTYAQSQFDVVSIRPAQPGARNSGYRRSAPGVFNATNVTLKMLLTYAYDVKDYQISGGPGWIDDERYEILAKSDPATSEPASQGERQELIRGRVRVMLADRFQLTLHRATKELPIFRLVLAKNGPKGLNAPKSAEPDLIYNGHHLTCSKTTMDSFAKIFLQGQLGRPVVNETALAGEFDFILDWAPDENQEGPSFFTALQEQLGLRLEPSKGPVDILVIDHANHPSQN